MIYIKVDGDWYFNKYERYNQLKMYETGHLSVAYDSNLDEIIANEVWNYKDGYKHNPISNAQVRLELFLQGEKFHEWCMYIHRFGENLTSHRMNMNIIT